MADNLRKPSPNRGHRVDGAAVAAYQRDLENGEAWAKSVETELQSPQRQGASDSEKPEEKTIAPPHGSAAQPTSANVPPQATTEAKSNPMATTGMTLGLVSILFWWIGILPILGIVFSGIGLAKVKECSGRGQVSAWIGLVVSIVYTLVYMQQYGHLR